MGLFNVSRAYGLESEVQRRTREYEARLIAVGGRLVDELDLEGDLFGLMREEGLRVEEDEDRRLGILRLLATYPEVSSEAAKLCLLIEHEEHHGRRERDPENTEESAGVTEYLASHPELEAEAIERVIRTNELAQVYSSVQTGTADGMCTLNSCLLKLYRQGVITRDMALHKSPRVKEFLEHLDGEAGGNAFRTIRR